MKQLFRKYKALKAFTALVKDPYQTDEVFDLADSIEDEKFWKPIVEHLERQPLGRKAIDQKVLIKSLDMDRLAQLPENTLGRAYYEFIDNKKLDPEFFPKLELTTKVKYVKHHLYQSHDLWHIVTGFETDPAGELGLQAFYLAQMPALLPVMIISAGMLNGSIYNPDDVHHRMDEVTKGWQLGKSAESLFGTDWEQYWDWTLDDIRKKYRIRSIHNEDSQMVV